MPGVMSTMVRLALLNPNLPIASVGRSSSATIRTLERSAVTDYDYITMGRGEVCLTDEAPASLHNVCKQFAAGGLERRVTGEVLADPLSVFVL